MKRWGFAGGPASHGTTKAHRTPGSIGACQDPGKVWKGKKMPGHMGCQIREVKSVWIYKVDPSRNLIYVRGQVPGHKGNYVFLQDTRIKARKMKLPFPTHIGTAHEIELRNWDSCRSHTLSGSCGTREGSVPFISERQHLSRDLEK